MTWVLPDGRSGGDGTAVAAVDVYGRIIWWNPQAGRLLGYAPTQVAGRAAPELLAEALPTAALRALVCRTPWRGELRLRRSDGSAGAVICELQPNPWATAGPDWIVLAASPGAAPPGQSVRGERSAVLTDRAFTQAPLAMSLYDRQGQLVRANSAMERLSGRHEEEMRGRTLHELMAAPPLDTVAEAAATVLETGHEARVQTLEAGGAGEQQRLLTSFLTPVTDDDRTVGLAGVVVDTTREYLAGQRLSLAAEAAGRIGTTLDVVRTARELVDFLCGRFADWVCVDLVADCFDGLGDTGGKPVDHRAGSPLLRVAERGGPRPQQAFPARRGRTSWAGRLWEAGGARQTGTGDGARHGATTSDPGPADHDAALVVALRAQGELLGLVRFARDRGHPPFDAEEHLLARSIVARAALSLDNARRYLRERSVAVTLQRSLLPQEPAVQNAVEVGFRYLPAATAAGVGGDWFDVIPLSGARVALVVGDVVGHGLHASATMGRLRMAVRTLADLDLPPDELLARLDDMVVRDAAEWAAGGDFAAEICATCVYAVYDPVSRRCSVACAGHPVPVVVTPDGGAEFLDVVAGPPLGIGGLPFEALDLRLPEGSLLALYSDGLVEGMDRDLVRNTDTLLRTLGGEAASVEDACERAVGTLVPEDARDDVTLLVTRTRTLPDERVHYWDLSSDPAAVGEARALVREQLGRWGLRELEFATELVVSELVTNALRHAEAPVRLRLIRDTGLICEVSDASNTSPRQRRARALDEGGRGLLLVARLTHRWGTRFTPDGKTIWAEQRIEAPCTGG
ncbi:SpoIIE family protein phosphatase [Streptomyces sp. cg36]|uniref:SpoIIE family protein phosphatase n=1 Tax=Streptomyces sp. cg36 TaxID=3238798 RepID=UPI0034E277AC